MKTCMCLIGLFACLASPPFDDEAKKEAIRKDRQSYEGVWKVTSLEANGVKSADADIEKITVANNKDGTWIIKLEGKQFSYGTSTIDPTKKPKTIDFIPSDGANPGQTQLGIYEIDGDTRKLCFAEPGKARPTEFKSEAGSGVILVTFKRVKEK